MSLVETGRIVGGMDTPRTFNEAYCRRVQQLRKGMGWTQKQMATALNVPLDRYKKYETRTRMPPDLVERFALIVRRDVHYILTGNNGARVPEPLPTPPAPRARARKLPVAVLKKGRR